MTRPSSPAYSARASKYVSSREAFTPSVPRVLPSPSAIIVCAAVQQTSDANHSFTYRLEDRHGARGDCRPCSTRSGVRTDRLRILITTRNETARARRSRASRTPNCKSLRGAPQYRHRSAPLSRHVLKGVPHVLDAFFIRFCCVPRDLAFGAFRPRMAPALGIHCQSFACRA